MAFEGNKSYFWTNPVYSSGDPYAGDSPKNVGWRDKLEGGADRNIFILSESSRKSYAVPRREDHQADQPGPCDNFPEKGSERKKTAGSLFHLCISGRKVDVQWITTVYYFVAFAGALRFINMRSYRRALCVHFGLCGGGSIRIWDESSLRGRSRRVDCSRTGRGATKQPWECRKIIFRRQQGVHACIMPTSIKLPRVQIWGLGRGGVFYQF